MNFVLCWRYHMYSYELMKGREAGIDGWMNVYIYVLCIYIYICVCVCVCVYYTRISLGVSLERAWRQ